MTRLEQMDEADRLEDLADHTRLIGYIGGRRERADDCQHDPQFEAVLRRVVIFSIGMALVSFGIWIGAWLAQ